MTAEGRKFSGSAFHRNATTALHHGTIMMDVKGDDLSKYLNVPESKLKSKGVASVRSRVTNLREHVDEPLRSADSPALIEAMKDAMIRAAAEEYGCEPEVCGLPDVPQSLKSKYASEEWRLGTRIPFEKEIVHRFGWGEVQALLSMKGEYIRDCRLYSDSLETEMFDALSGLLKGCRYDASDIRSLELPAGISENARELLEFIAEGI